ncbi:MAG: DnaJ domain-containing protein [Chloroflexota bacterium]|nr:DnaJ domain-containing protein [Chloroflexota bacterium]
MTYRLNTGVDVRQTRREIVNLFGKWRGAELISIADTRDLSDERAVVVFGFNGNRVRVEYNQQAAHRSNLRAIFLTLEGIRMAYRRGMGELMTNTVSQMLALPGVVYIGPYELLGVRPDAPIDLIEAAWKHQLKQWHPDRHPDDQEEATKRTQQLNEAIERVRADRREGA